VNLLRRDTPRPSNWLLVMSIATWLLALAFLTAGVIHQVTASRPVGEGDVFVADAATAQNVIDGADSLTAGVAHARNQLDVEAVSVVDRDGVVIASTTDTLIGGVLGNDFLLYGIDSHRFAALATESDVAIEVGGVTEWPAGSVLYEVLSPMPDGNLSVLLHYDVADLLSRRAQPGDIEPLTLQLLALGVIFGLLGGGLLVGHSRASRRNRELAVESELLRAHSEQLAGKNIELAEARTAAERALALSEEKMRIRSDFVLMINHELRTPLTTVVTGADVIRHGSLTVPEREAVLDDMITHGRRLQEIIDQILAVARIENSGLSYEMKRVALEEVCEVTDATISFDVDPDRQVWVNTDVRTLALVIDSLVDNARTHGASGVEITCSRTAMLGAMTEVGVRPDSAVFMSVTDDGPGIDPHFLPRAFEKFEKDSFMSGTGLGLYMVRLMVEALSGSIAVRTSPEGTTFQIALPAGATTRIRESV
jgi:signal transduction histidine kinase